MRSDITPQSFVHKCKWISLFISPALFVLLDDDDCVEAKVVSLLGHHLQQILLELLESAPAPVAPEPHSSLNLSLLVRIWRLVSYMYTGSFSIGSRTEMSFLTSTRVVLVGRHSRMKESRAA